MGYWLDTLRYNPNNPGPFPDIWPTYPKVGYQTLSGNTPPVLESAEKYVSNS